MPKGFPLKFTGVPNFDNLKKEIEEKLNDPNKGPSWIESVKTGEFEGYTKVKINRFTVKVYGLIYIDVEDGKIYFECSYDSFLAIIKQRYNDLKINQKDWKATVRYSHAKNISETKTLVYFNIIKYQE